MNNESNSVIDELTQQRVLDSEDRICSIGYAGEEATLHAPYAVLEPVKLIVFYYSALVREFHGKRPPSAAVQQALGAKLREYLEQLALISAVEVRSVPSTQVNPQPCFAIKFTHDIHGRWQLEVPPVTTASLVRLGQALT